jgi:FixJ family two-component response regulator
VKEVLAPTPTVLVVDDDSDLGASIARLLQRHGFDAQSFLDPTPLLAAMMTLRSSHRRIASSPT